MFPDLPTPTNTPEPEEVVVVSLVGVVVVPEELEVTFLEHEMTVKLKRETIIMSKIFFIRSLITSFFCLPLYRYQTLHLHRVRSSKSRAEGPRKKKAPKNRSPPTESEIGNTDNG